MWNIIFEKYLLVCLLLHVHYKVKPKASYTIFIFLPVAKDASLDKRMRSIVVNEKAFLCSWVEIFVRFADATS